MRLSTILTIASVLALAFGLAFHLAPGPMLAQYAIRADATDLLMSRFFGAALVYLGLLIVLARRVTTPEAQWALALGGVLGSPLVGLAVALWGQLSDAVNALGWLTVAIYLLLALGYGYILAAKPRAL